MYIVLSCTTNDIITAVMDCVVSHVMRKCCDCVVHESEVWTWLHRCNSHTTKVFVKRTISVFAVYGGQLARELYIGGCLLQPGIVFSFVTHVPSRQKEASWLLDTGNQG